MILNEITLRNFCLYRGEQTFDLTATRRNGKSSPIVLFGGINGGGKTTLLDAVQLVLYGIRARCSKRNDKAYDEFLRESIHHGVDPSEGATIQLSFRYAEKGHEHLYEVTRSWSDVRGRIRERVQVCRDGEVDGWLGENWSQIVEELLPYGIAQLFFFDAEKIRFLAEDETSTRALGGAIKSLLGLDLAERLVTDASVLEGRIAKRTRKSADLQNLEQLEEQLQEKQSEIERLVQEKGALENPRQAAQARLNTAETKFAKIGGKHWEQRKERERKLAEVGQFVKNAEEQLVALAVTELPLALIPDLLQGVANQSEKERNATESKIVTKLLADRDRKVLDMLEQESVSADSLRSVDQFLESDRKERAASTDVDQRLQLSENGQRLLDHLLTRGFDERTQATRELLVRVENGRREKEDLQRGIAATPDEDSVREVANQLKESSSELAGLEQQINRIDKQLDTARNERSTVQGDLQKLRRTVVDEQISGEENVRLADLLIRTQETMKQFLSRATHSKIDRLSELITQSFRYLLHKTTLVQRVQIDPDSFAITLYNDAGNTIPKQRLSEGEKQIFAISVLWGLSQASARPLPAIIDTPMARLDVDHRNQLVERYFPHASHQVIVLSTDTEIDQQYFHDLQPYIARAYHLSYDEIEKQTVAEEGYFWDVESSEKLEEVVA
jgi:DNA sulfur modification protein DndD